MRVTTYKGIDLHVNTDGTWSAAMDEAIIGRGFKSMNEAKDHVDKHYAMAKRLDVYKSSGSGLVQTVITSVYHNANSWGSEDQARYKTPMGGTSSLAFNWFYEMTPNNKRIFKEMEHLEGQIRELEMKRRELHLLLDGKLSLERYKQLVGFSE